MRSSLDGKFLTDVILADGGYNYYLYVSSGNSSSYIIMRYNTAETEYRYAFGVSGSKSDLDTTWTNRASQTYIRPNELSGRG